VIIYELTKLFLLGNIFLPESLVVYPLIWLLSIFFLGTKKLKQWELVLSGFSLSAVIFLLAPLWPLALMLFVLLLARSGDRFNTLKLVFLGGLPILALSFWVSSFLDYLHQAIYINLRYFVPLTSTEPLTTSLFKAFVAPVLSFFSQAESAPTLRVIQMLSLLLIFNVFLLIKSRKFSLVIFSVLVLFLSNLRYIQPGQEYYRGFHLLPWFATLIFLEELSSKLD
jgi:hypothetical protein